MRHSTTIAHMQEMELRRQAEWVRLARQAKALKEENLAGHLAAIAKIQQAAATAFKEKLSRESKNDNPSKSNQE